MSRLKSLAKDTVVFGVGTGLSKLILFFLLPMFAVAMSVESYGLAELVVSVVSIVMPIMTLQISDAVFRFAIEDEHSRVMAYRLGFLIVSVGTILLGLVCAIASAIVPFDYYFDFFLLYTVASYSQLMKYYIRGLGHVALFAFSGVANAAAVAVCGAITVLVLGLDVHGYLVSFAAGYAIELFVVAIVDRKYVLCFGKLDMKVSRDALRYALPLIPNAISWWFAGVSSRYFLTFFCGLAASGLFSAAYKLSAVINALTDVFAKAWQYSAAKEFTSKDKDVFYREAFLVYEFFLSFVVSIAILFMKPFCTLLLAGGFSKAWVFAQFLLISAMLSGYSSFFGVFYGAAKKNAMVMISTIVGAITCVVLNLVLLPSVGEIGSVLANCAATFCIAAIRAFDTRRFASGCFSWKRTTAILALLATEAVCLTMADGNIVLGAIFVPLVIGCNHEALKAVSLLVVGKLKAK